MSRLAKAVSLRWQRIPDRRREKLKVTLWWICTMVAAVTMASVIIRFDDPDHAPYAGALMTVFAYYSFTRLKGRQDSYAQGAQHQLIELISRNAHYEILNYKIDLEAEIYRREVEDRKLRQQIKRLSDKLSGQSPDGMTIAYSSSARDHDPSPRRPASLNQPKTSIANYAQLCADYRMAVERHRAWSGRLALMEAISIIYGAAVSAFGADFIRFWNG